MQKCIILTSFTQSFFNANIIRCKRTCACHNDLNLYMIKLYDTNNLSLLIQRNNKRKLYLAMQAISDGLP